MALPDLIGEKWVIITMMEDGFSSVLETEVKLQGILNALYNK